MAIFPSLITFYFLTPQRYLCVKIGWKTIFMLHYSMLKRKNINASLVSPEREDQKQYLVLEKSLKREQFSAWALSWIIDPDRDHSKVILHPYYQIEQPHFYLFFLQKAAIWRGSVIIILDCLNIQLSWAECWNTRVLQKIRSRQGKIPSAGKG